MPGRFDLRIKGKLAVVVYDEKDICGSCSHMHGQVVEGRLTLGRWSDDRSTWFEGLWETEYVEFRRIV